MTWRDVGGPDRRIRLRKINFPGRCFGYNRWSRMVAGRSSLPKPAETIFEKNSSIGGGGRGVNAHLTTVDEWTARVSVYVCTGRVIRDLTPTNGNRAAATTTAARTRPEEFTEFPTVLDVYGARHTSTSLPTRPYGLPLARRRRRNTRTCTYCVVIVL